MKKNKKNEKHVVTTAEEFWTIIEEAGLAYKDIWGYDGLLNTIGILISEGAKYREIKGRTETQKIYEDMYTKIHNALDEKGYYEQFK